jgi:hypothetical protein
LMVHPILLLLCINLADWLLSLISFLD